ncbi:MAG: hypothetical protein ACM3JJ_03775 [Hyphomicrobiales bacterium]
MRPYLLERHDEREDHPATLTEYDLDLLEARARWGVIGAWIALAAVVLLIGVFVRSEFAIRGVENAARAREAALTANVQALTEQLAERTAESRIASTAMSATEPSADRLRGQIGALAARQQALASGQEALAARVEQQAGHVANLGLWRSGIDAAQADRDARLGALETSAKATAGGFDTRVAKLERKVDSIDKTVTTQQEVLASTRKKQSAMIAAIPIFLGPYIHVIDHGGR